MITIKKATKADAKDISLLEKEIFSPSNYPISYRSILYNIKKNIFFTAFSDNYFAGHSLFLINKRYNFVRLYSIAISPQFQNLGIAKEILNYSFKYIFEAGYSKITLEVRVDNLKAISLYQKLGFETIKIIKEYYKDGCNALKMQKYKF